MLRMSLGLPRVTFDSLRALYIHEHRCELSRLKNWGLSLSRVGHTTYTARLVSCVGWVREGNNCSWSPKLYPAEN